MHTAFAELAQLDAHPSMKAKDEDSAQGANRFNQSRIAVGAPNLHMHSGQQRTGVMSSGQLLPAVWYNCSRGHSARAAVTIAFIMATYN